VFAWLSLREEGLGSVDAKENPIVLPFCDTTDGTTVSIEASFALSIQVKGD
jgi:hypothetical protein